MSESPDPRPEEVYRRENDAVRELEEARAEFKRLQDIRHSGIHEEPDAAETAIEAREIRRAYTENIDPTDAMQRELEARRNLESTRQSSDLYGKEHRDELHEQAKQEEPGK